MKTLNEILVIASVAEAIEKLGMANATNKSDIILWQFSKISSKKGEWLPLVTLTESKNDSSNICINGYYACITTNYNGFFDFFERQGVDVKAIGEKEDKVVCLTTIDGEVITKWSQFRKQTHHTISGTRFLNVFIEGRAITIRMHWSYDGKYWSMFEGHDFDTMKSIETSIVLKPVGKQLGYTDKNGDNFSEKYTCISQYVEQEVEFVMVKR